MMVSRGLRFAVLLIILVFALGVFMLPYFPAKIPSTSAIPIIQSMIEVNGVLYALSATVIGIFGIGKERKVKTSSIFIFLMGVTGIFFISIFFDVIDLANMGSTIANVYVIRDILTPVAFSLAFIYLTGEIYGESTTT